MTRTAVPLHPEDPELGRPRIRLEAMADLAAGVHVRDHVSEKIVRGTRHGQTLIRRARRFQVSTGIGVVALLVALVMPLTAAAGGGNVDARSRAFVRQMHGCDGITQLAIQAVQQNPNDLIGASEAVNTAKSTCEAIRNRMALMDTTHFSSQAINAEVAVDFWTRGLGRFSNYIDSGAPSDVAKAAEYFRDARSAATLALRGINQRRAIYGLTALR